MIGLERPVDLGPRHLDDDLVGETEVVEQDGRSGSVSKQSLTEESTALDQHCPTRSGPASPAAWMAKLSASTNLTPATIGSMPSLAQARSQNDKPGTTSRVIELA